MSQGTKTYLILASAAFVLYYASGFVQDYCHGSGATTRFCRRTHLSSAPAPASAPTVQAQPQGYVARVAAVPVAPPPPPPPPVAAKPEPTPPAADTKTTENDNRPVMPDSIAPATAPGAPAPPAAETMPPQPAPAKPASRLIVLGDVIYKNPSEWTIWLDGKPVTPAVKPKEVIEISVTQNAVHLKWFDMDSSKLIEATLPPHAAYDMDRHVVVPAPAAAK